MVRPSRSFIGGPDSGALAALAGGAALAAGGDPALGCDDALAAGALALLAGAAPAAGLLAGALAGGAAGDAQAATNTVSAASPASGAERSRLLPCLIQLVALTVAPFPTAPGPPNQRLTVTGGPRPMDACAGRRSAQWLGAQCRRRAGAMMTIADATRHAVV